MRGWNERGALWLRQRTTEQWIDQAWIVGVGLAAIALFTAGLGDVALRDWDEGIVAGVAKAIWRSQTRPDATLDPLTWLYPTLNGEPYYNKPTLMHWLIAQMYRLGGSPEAAGDMAWEWLSRFPGALLSAVSVPLLYCVGRELFHRRLPAVFATLVYLTFIPVVRLGRLAMLDGASVCFALVLLYCLLRSRRDLRWGLGVGLGFGLICLTKGLLGVLLLGLALVFIYWDTPRLLTSWYLWLGMALGGAPVLAWYWAQWTRYGPMFLGNNVVNQSLSRLWQPVEGNQGPIWYYFLELGKYALPWLVFLPQGYKLAWENRTLGWAKFVLVWSVGYFAVISVMQTKLPWYILPLYPALALTVGAHLETLWEGGDWLGPRYLARRQYPIAWGILFGVMAMAGWGVGIYLGLLSPVPKLSLLIVLSAIALMFTAVTILVIQRDSQFILVLVWGMYVSLLMLMLSPHWLWELEEAFPVRPVADMVQKHTLPGEQVITSYPTSRPSLNFYSDRAVISVVPYYQQQGLTFSADATQAKQEAIARWKDGRNVGFPYLLLEPDMAKNFTLDGQEVLARTDDGWVLLRRKTTTAYASTTATQLIPFFSAQPVESVAPLLE